MNSVHNLQESSPRVALNLLMSSVTLIMEVSKVEPCCERVTWKVYAKHFVLIGGMFLEIKSRPPLAIVSHTIVSKTDLV